MSFFDKSLEGMGPACTIIGGAGEAPMGEEGKLADYMNVCGYEVIAGSSANNPALASVDSANGWNFLKPKPSTPGMGG